MQDSRDPNVLLLDVDQTKIYEQHQNWNESSENDQPWKIF